jgi:hypothetical protein
MIRSSALFNFAAVGETNWHSLAEHLFQTHQKIPNWRPICEPIATVQFLLHAWDRLKSLVAEAGILVLASHSRELIKSICNRIVELENGRAKYDESAEVFFTAAKAGGAAVARDIGLVSRR